MTKTTYFVSLSLSVSLLTISNIFSGEFNRETERGMHYLLTQLPILLAFIPSAFSVFGALATLVLRYLITDTFSRKEMLSIMRFFVIGHDKEKRDCGFEI